MRFIQILFIVLFFNYPSFANYPGFGVMVDLSTQDKNRISNSVPTQSAITLFRKQRNDIYWFKRNAPHHYHITLELLKPKTKANFDNNDLNHLTTILQNFNKHAHHLNQSPKGKKGYMANGYELVLFAHTKGAHNQKQSYSFTIKNIDQLPKMLQEVTYANLVLHIGTKGQLRDDWKYVRNHILTKPHHQNVMIPSVKHDLKTHVTIGNIFKYDRNKYLIRGNRIEDRQNPNKKIYNKPFRGNDLSLIVTLFKEVHKNFKPISNIFLDRLFINTKANGKTQKLKEVVFH